MCVCVNVRQPSQKKKEKRNIEFETHRKLAQRSRKAHQAASDRTICAATPSLLSNYSQTLPPITIKITLPTIADQSRICTHINIHMHI